MEKFTSPEHEAIGNRIALKQGPMSKENKNLASGERKKVDDLPTMPNLGGIVPVPRFTSEEHQAIGNTIEFNEVPKRIAEFNSDEHRGIGNAINFKREFGDIEPIAKLEFNSDEHRSIGNAIHFKKEFGDIEPVAEFNSDEHRSIGNAIHFKPIPEFTSPEHKKGGDVAVRGKINIGARKNRRKNIKEIEKVGQDVVDGTKKVAEGLIKL